MTAITFIKSLHSYCKFNTKEGNGCGITSNSELVRWIKNKAVVINGKALSEPNEEISFPLGSVILFPKHSVSLWFDKEVVIEDCIIYVCEIFDDLEKLSTIDTMLQVKFEEHNIREVIESLNYKDLYKLYKFRWR